MPNDLTPGDFDYDGMGERIARIVDQAIRDGADPQFVASRVYTESMATALRNGLTCTLKHILLVQEQAERDMRRFYDTYDHRYDLREVLRGNIVPK